MVSNVRKICICVHKMGIQGLMKLIGDYAPSAVKDNDIKCYFGKVKHRLAGQ